MSQSKKKTQKNNVKLPELKSNFQEDFREKELTDPPQLKKGNLKPISNYPAQRATDPMLKLVDIFEKTQTEFTHIYKQILSLTERQDSFNRTMLEYMESGPQSAGSGGGEGERREEVEPRYRFFLVEGSERGVKMDPARIRKWLTRLFSQTFSVAFHRFSKKEMTFEHAKTFCASNILRNVIYNSDKAELTANGLQLMEEEMGRLLKYLQLKYPLTESTEINKALEGAVQQVDNLGLLAHNYFATSQLVFEWRESGNYSDLVMKMLNDIFEKIDQRSPYEKMTNYADFKKCMTAIFDSVDEEEEVESVQSPEDYMPGLLDFVTDRYVRAKSALKEYPQADRLMKDSSKIRQDKDRYRNRVKEYTHYAIGRKVPQSYQPYTNKEIESNNMAIKSPAVLRILTKWTEELRNKFSTPDYYAALSDAIKSQKGTVHSLLFPQRKMLDEEMRREEIEIQRYLKSAAKENYDLQVRLIRKELKRASRPLDGLELEEVCGRYSIEMLNSLHSHLIGYLNRLIHGLASVSKRFYERSEMANAGWSSPPDLVTFTIGDLLRCKMSSKEKEILRVYDQLKQASVRNPEKLKIIRVKNRLNKSTNDILVNVKFNNLITAEIQLAVKVQTSDFIKSSNTFCHFLYELERSPFGAVAELCNVWAALDRTAESFKEILDAQAARQTPIRSHNCLTPQYVPFQRPFICYTCEVPFYHNGYLRNHMQCQQCRETICAKCLLREQDPQELKALLISNKALRASCKELIKRIDTSENLSDGDVPQFGVCISIERREPNLEIFHRITYRNSRYLLAREGGQLYEVEKIQTAKQLASFLRKYLIFKLQPDKAQKFINLSQDEAIERWILPRALASAYRRQKETLVIGENLGNEVLRKALRPGLSEGKGKVRKMFLDSNQITTVDYIAEEFRNLVLLELSYNPVESLEGLERLQYLKSLSLSGCALRAIPPTMFVLRSLEELRLSDNRLSFIEGIGRLQKLKLLDLSGNNLESLPSEIGKCSELVLLRLDNNMLQSLPAEIQQLRELRQLFLAKNQLRGLPREIEHLSALEQLELRENQIDALPETFGKLFTLQKLDISSNLLQGLLDSFEDLQSLRWLNLSRNANLCSLPQTFSHLTLLQSLNLSECGFTQFPKQLCELVCLRSLKISYNKLETLPSIQPLHSLQIFEAIYNRLSSKTIKDQFCKLPKLHTLKLSNNHLTAVPNFSECQKLKNVDLSYNQIVEISQGDIVGLETLQVLRLDHNQLEKIANGLITLPKLRQINLAVNRLQKLGAELHAIWPSLLKIDLSQNEFNEVPPCLLNSQLSGSVSHIASIDISSNKISELPVGLTKLKHLKQFKCNKNQLRQVTGELERFMREKKIDHDIKDVREGKEVRDTKEGRQAKQGREGRQVKQAKELRVEETISPYRKPPSRSKQLRKL